MACPAELPKCWTGSRETCALPPPVSFGLVHLCWALGKQREMGPRLCLAESVI